jgi:hypothetical protein
MGTTLRVNIDQTDQGAAIIAPTTGSTLHTARSVDEAIAYARERGWEPVRVWRFGSDGSELLAGFIGYIGEDGTVVDDINYFRLQRDKERRS